MSEDQVAPKPRKIRLTARPISAPQGAEGDPIENEPVELAVPEKTGGPLRSIEGLLGVCLAVGICIALAGAIMGGVVGEKLALGAPVFATIAYPLAGLWFGFHKKASQRERFADNCYYLGFIFTQAGLILAFLPATFFGQDISSTKVMQFFGMAIGAALAGLIARTLLIQSGMSITDANDDIHQEVTTLARNIAKQAEEISETFSQIAVAVGTVPERFADRLDQQFEGVAQTLRRLDESIVKTANAYEDSREKIVVATDGAKGEQESRIAELGKKFSDAGAAIIGLKAEIVTQSDALVKLLDDATTGIKRGTDAISGLSVISEKLPAIQEDISGLKTASGDAKFAATDLVSSISSIKESLEGAATSGGDTIADASKAAATAISGAGEKATKEIATRADSFSGDLKAATDAFSDAVNAFNERLAAIALKKTDAG